MNDIVSDKGFACNLPTLQSRVLTWCFILPVLPPILLVWLLHFVSAFFGWVSGYSHHHGDWLILGLMVGHHL
jgi:hypothetical protein